MQHSLTRAKLKARLPEIIAAATRATQPLAEVHTCPALDYAAHAGMQQPAPLLHDAAWQSLQAGETWGVHPAREEPPPELLPWGIAPDGGSTHWLYAPLRVPRAWQGQQVVLALEWQGSGQASLEAIVYLDGQELAGLDEFHRTVLLPAAAHSGEHTLLLRCTLPYPQPFGGLSLRLRDEHIFHLGQMMRVALDAVESCRESDPARHAMLARLDEAYNLLDLREGWQNARFTHSAHAALELLRHTLTAGIERGQRPHLIATGHAHLDVAWLWPLWRTRQKAVHTVATALHLMERYPNYHFSMSQPQVYAFLKEDAPDLYARLRQRAAEGRFEPVGMLWVESDCNLPSGESLVRQLMHGAHFFAEEFGTINHVAWLPDTFGFTAALPQLLRGCGISCMMTSKLSWNQTNRMPADTFRWRGIDGSEVLTHLLTAPSDDPADQQGSIPRSTYVGKMTPQQAAGTWEHYRQQAMNDELLYVYGYGDGGGGPTEEMLATLELLEDLPGLPAVRPGRVEQFFEHLYERVWQHPDLPTWVGELYLEYHRGTLTSQADTKDSNHSDEFYYRHAEWLNAWAVTLGAENRQPELNEGWQALLLNQFHDILPGSSIGQVYEESEEYYINAVLTGAGICREARAHIFPASEQHTEHGFPSLDQYVINALSWERQGVVSFPLSDDDEPQPFTDAQGRVLPQQTVENFPHRGEYISLCEASAPAYGYTLLKLSSSKAKAGRSATKSLKVTREKLENTWLRLQMDANGEIASLYDKEHAREIIPPGTTANQLVAYEDRPLQWDAWDIDPFYEEKPYPVRHILAWHVVETGPLRAAIEMTRQVGQSTITQRIALWHNRRRIDFATLIDWKERQTLLRALFPLDVNTDRATCGIQFGALERPTHHNTSWEQARFEVCAHGWVDMSEGGYGVALLNDGKYGHSIRHNVIGISLLKGSVFPDPDADLGEHSFTYSLYPHAGDWRASQVARRAYELSMPLYALGSDEPPRQSGTFSFLSTPTEHIIVETIKVAEDGNGLIVRLYEAHNRRGPARLLFGYPVAAAVETDLLECEIGPVTVEGHEITFSVRPFEVKTLRVWLQQPSRSTLQKAVPEQRES